MSDWGTWARRIRVPVGFVFAVLYLWLARPTAASIIAGAAVAAVGLALRAWASGHVSKAEEITQSGPYAYTRNPLYLGSILVGAGFALAARSPWIAAGMLALFLAVYIPVIRWEEAWLRAHLGGFDEYAARVPRLLPRVTPAGVPGAFSRERYLKHREYNALLGAVAMLAALVIKLRFL
ncbi:MAG TPA: isoprenylcysteine carboxylmethyltransferase family protein [Terriglobales bacterium]|nr:isoprenylcysteine carboxylmethyltransferase family protein [Terriglobales bacterium]